MMRQRVPVPLLPLARAKLLPQAPTVPHPGVAAKGAVGKLAADHAERCSASVTPRSSPLRYA
jgi:hypothetical protein